MYKKVVDEVRVMGVALGITVEIWNTVERRPFDGRVVALGVRLRLSLK